MNKLGANVVTIAMGIIGLATLAILVSRNARTTSVVSSLTGGFSDALGVAISPVTGGGGGIGGNFTAPSIPRIGGGF